MFLVHQILSKHRVIYLIRFNFQDVETDIIELDIYMIDIVDGVVFGI